VAYGSTALKARGSQRQCSACAQGVLILRPPDAALHALVLLGMNAAFALASGCAAKSDAVADLPWSGNIMQDDSVVLADLAGVDSQ
jgi:hypothetical protein